MKELTKELAYQVAKAAAVYKAADTEFQNDNGRYFRVALAYENLQYAKQRLETHKWLNS